jgi:hypothetical protein
MSLLVSLLPPPFLLPPSYFIFSLLLSIPSQIPTPPPFPRPFRPLADSERGIADVVWVDNKQIGLIDSIFRNYYLPPIIFG